MRAHLLGSKHALQACSDAPLVPVGACLHAPCPSTNTLCTTPKTWPSLLVTWAMWTHLIRSFYRSRWTRDDGCGCGPSSMQCASNCKASLKPPTGLRAGTTSFTSTAPSPSPNGRRSRHMAANAAAIYILQRERAASTSPVSCWIRATVCRESPVALAMALAPKP